MGQDDTKKLDAIAHAYDPSTSETDFDYWILKSDLETLKKFMIGDVVVELGCGRGVITKELGKIARTKLLVVEGSKENIEFSKKEVGKNGKVEFHNCMWQDFGYGGKATDIVFFSGLEHLSEEDGKSVLLKIRAWMDKGSRLHIIVPNMNSLHRVISWYGGIIKNISDFSERDRMLGHKTQYDKNRLFSMLSETGYSVAHWEGIFLKPFPNGLMMKLGLKKEDMDGLYKAGGELPAYCAHIYACCTKSSG